MSKNRELPEDIVHGSAVAVMDRAPVLAVRLGRGRTGGTTGLSWLIDRARNQGRSVIAADGDRRNATLKSIYPDAMQPASDDTADVRDWITEVLDRMTETQQSVALDLGGGDRVLADYGRDLALLDYCADIGARPLALYFMGPDKADFEHVLSIFRAGYFRPHQSLLVLNENLIPSGKSPAGAFKPVMALPEFGEMLAAGVQPINMPLLPCMDKVRETGIGFYDAGAGKKGANGMPLGPTHRFMVRNWLKAIETQIAEAGATEWLP
jgi:hypothetical protein